MDIKEELDLKFRKLDDESKLVVALWAFSQCACSHRRFVALGQLKHAHDYVVTDDATRTAAAVSPRVVEIVEEIRRHVQEVSSAPPAYLTSDLGPAGDAYRRSFLWGEAFEEPVWFQMRHPAREGLRIAEDHFRAAAA